MENALGGSLIDPGERCSKAYADAFIMAVCGLFEGARLRVSEAQALP
jgi:hypothetical protein